MEISREGSGRASAELSGERLAKNLIGQALALLEMAAQKPAGESARLVSSEGVSALPQMRPEHLDAPAIAARIYNLRRARADFFDEKLFGEPAWDMLLDLLASEGAGKRLSVSALCVGSKVPATTALRWIDLLQEKGLIERTDDPADKRRNWIRLSKEGALKLNRLFSQNLDLL